MDRRRSRPVHAAEALIRIAMCASGVKLRFSSALRLVDDCRDFLLLKAISSYPFGSVETPAPTEQHKTMVASRPGNELELILLAMTVSEIENMVLSAVSNQKFPDSQPNSWKHKKFKGMYIWTRCWS